MDPIIKRLFENRQTLVENEELETEIVEEEEEVVPAEEEEVIEEQDEVPEEEETLEEDWRSGTFTDQDMKRYYKEMHDKAKALLFSIEHMAHKHPEMEKEFNNLRAAIRKMF